MLTKFEMAADESLPLDVGKEMKIGGLKEYPNAKMHIRLNPPIPAGKDVVEIIAKQKQERVKPLKNIRSNRLL